MKELTIREIRGGTPSPQWAAEVAAEVGSPLDLWRAELGEVPTSYRDPAARAAWERGAWCAIRGDPDETRVSDHEFRAGYDWAARRALQLDRWEAWALALREVEERRPIGRSAGGVRYYDSGVTVPPEIARLKPAGVALWLSLHGMQGSRQRWSIYRQLGIDDQDLALAISREYGSVSAGEVGGVPYRGEGCRRFNDMNGGRQARFHFGRVGKERKLAGPELVSRARALLRLPTPGLLAVESSLSATFDLASPAFAAAPGTPAAARAEQLGLF